MEKNKYFSLVTTKNELICKNIKRAESFNERLVGLMFKDDFTDFSGLLIDPCNSIHTFFMKISLDVIFLDKNFKVIKVIYNLRPWKMTWIYLKANKVLEMKAGTLKKDLMIGEVLREYV